MTEDHDPTGSDHPITRSQTRLTQQQKPSLCARLWRSFWKIRKRRKDSSHPKANWAEKTTVIVTVVIAGVGAIQAGIYYQQKKIMESSSGQTDKLIASQKKIANLQYAAGSPNVRFAYFSLYHELDGKVWGWIRVRNEGTKFQAEFVSVAVNMDFRRTTPSQTERDNPGGFRDVAESPLQPYDPKYPEQQIGSVSVAKIFSKNETIGTQLFVWGKIRYQDIAGETEEKSFCRYIPGFMALPEGAAGGYGPYKYVGGDGKDCPEQNLQ